MLKLKLSLCVAAIGAALSAVPAQAAVIVSDDFTEDTPGTEPGQYPSDADSPWTYLSTTGTGTGSAGVVEQAAAASDPFGVAGNKYLKLVSPATDTGIAFRSKDRFDLNLLTISFDVHEPGDGGGHTLSFDLRSGLTTIYGIAFDDGKIDGLDAYAVDTDAHVDLIVNGTGADVTHLGQTIGDGSLGLWVDGAYVGNIDGNASAEGANVTELRFTIINPSLQTLLIDNFQVSDEAVVVPEPGSLALLFAGALAMAASRTRR